MFSTSQFRIALKIYSQINCGGVIRCMRGGSVKQALALLIEAGESV